jgi:glycosyltransferase involved in cell wall biosynthesis
MALPIPVLSATDAGRTLTRLWLDLDRAVPAPDGSPPGLMLAMPTAWANKYQLLLYKAAARHRWAVAGVTLPRDLAHVSWPGPVVLHAHWFAALFNGAATEAEAGARLTEATEQILAFRDRTGARLVWTAHNVFPHGNRFPETFLTLRRWVFQHFDAIHVMQDSHLPILEAAFGCRAPHSFAVPHMIYDGAIQDDLDPVAARAHFGLPRDAFVFGYFGSIQAYKQIGRLLSALDALKASGLRPVAALVGGIPVETDAVRDLYRFWDGRPDIRLIPRKILDHEIQYLHRAADVMVLPYAETLNSGAALMAATFRKPFIMPRGSASEGLGPLGAILFDPADPQALTAAMAAAMDTTPDPADPAALAARTPAAISDAFFGRIGALFRS